MGAEYNSLATHGELERSFILNDFKNSSIHRVNVIPKLDISLKRFLNQRRHQYIYQDGIFLLRNEENEKSPLSGSSEAHLA